MSRIEKAIEKATRLRQGVDDSNDTTKLVSPPADYSPERDIRSSAQALQDVKPLKVKSPFLPMVARNNDAVSEEYKKLRSLVRKLTKKESFLNTILVTSTVGSEGKSITALNLALALAQEYDHTVLLVDTDLRRPSIHRYLGLQPEVGLVNCLQEGLPVEKALIKTGLGKLVILPAGSPVENHLELLSSERMKRLIRELKSRYPERYVIFDTPPALPFADAQILGSEVDGVIYVIREGFAKTDQIREAMDSLKGTNLLGAVYNDSSVMPSAGRYSYYY
ncbi:polysaccharide biosynthesis tyrosine autokinase [Desulfuromonas sp. KJ2020]|uniref:polysaccharide biosynthesis tyrosine autokinase n=1 Tax=Desulfuromonas sp. KJ2020 TaxID=2919173 RepID=UPI0020A822A3|nr:polysaccharide biosynthesis tyrosine autokinase [Desulfuromonas sp. KJ2020]MCP3178156.1 polysaccharide biosynthesis tyrosine autokinase [Desulfuromonas sp. KJ2020]